jgi:hypothetical protein
MGAATGTSMYSWRDAIKYPVRTGLACARIARWARARPREAAQLDR